MKLFLLRHADAHNTYPDSARTLTEKGFEQVESLSGRVHKGLFGNLAQIWHSRLERAEQTAHAFAEAAGLSVPIIASDGFAPADSHTKAAKMIVSVAGLGADLMVVGHNPQLEDLATLLLTGKTGRPVLRFAKCSLLCLEMECERDSENPFGCWIATEFLLP